MNMSSVTSSYIFFKDISWLRVQLFITVKIRHCMRMNNVPRVADLSFFENLRLETNMKIFRNRTGTIDADMWDLFHLNKCFRCSKVVFSNVVKYKVNTHPFI